MVEITMLHRASGITHRGERCKNLRRKEAGKIAPEQENPCRGDDDEENKHSVDHRLPHRRRNAHLIMMPHHRNSACPHENNAAALALIAKKQPCIVPCQCGAARPAFAHHRIPNVIGICPIGQIEEAILHDRNADTRRLQQMNVTFNMIPFELLPLCGSTQRTQSKGNREIRSPLRPEQFERLLLQRSCMAQSAKKRRTDGDEDTDRYDDHQRIGQQELCFQRQITQVHSDTSLS